MREPIITLLLISGLAGVIYNGRLIFDEACYNLSEGYGNIDQGKPFSCGWGNDYNLLDIAKKNIPQDSSIYYWTIPELENEIATECQAIALNYYLYPVTVYYKNSRNIGLCSFIICENVFKPRLDCELTLLELDSGFSEIIHNERYAVFKRNILR